MFFVILAAAGVIGGAAVSVQIGNPGETVSFPAVAETAPAASLMLSAPPCGTPEAASMRVCTNWMVDPKAARDNCSPALFGPSEWRPMVCAPRDGTIIEIENRFGILPTYSLDRWSPRWPNGRETWVDAQHSNVSLISDDESKFLWRPFTGDASHYGANNPTRLDWCVAAGMTRVRCLKVLGAEADRRD